MYAIVPLFVSRLNDILALSSDSFYVTRTVNSQSKSGSILEIVLGLEWGHVILYDGKSAKVTDGVSANGITMSPDKK